jgi:hypothetical protein
MPLGFNAWTGQLDSINPPRIRLQRRNNWAELSLGCNLKKEFLPMKKFSLLALVMWFCFLPAARANLTGTVQGTIQVADNRNLGSVPAATGGLKPARRVFVAVTALPASSSSGVINPTFYAVTDHNGNFSSPWQDTTRNALPARLRVEVLWAGATTPAAGTTTPQATLFQIGKWEVSPGSVGSPTSLFRRDVSAVNSNLGTLTAPATEETAAYLTTEGFFFNIVRHSRTLRNRMPGLVVKTRVPGFNYLFGVSPFPHEVLVSENVPISNPLVLAHELGHAITWAALDLGSAPINPVSDYSHPSGSALQWSPLQREFSKAAFLEGLAEAWALRWAFGPDVSPVLLIGTSTFNYEAGTVTGPAGEVVLNCTSAISAHEFPFCHTVAVWDLLDSHNGGADTLTLTTANLVDTLNRFQNGACNGCRDEWGVDALNHNDFLCNATPLSRRVHIRAVWSADGISGGPSSSCGQ